MATEHWAPRLQAYKELGISLRKLDRMIRDGDIEVRRNGRLVFVLIDGPRPPTDEELLEKVQKELAESEVSGSEFRSEVRRLKAELRSMTDQASSARERAYLANAEASRARAEASGEKSKNQDLDRQLREEREERQYLTWVLIAMSVIVIAAMLVILRFG